MHIKAFLRFCMGAYPFWPLGESPGGGVGESSALAPIKGALSLWMALLDAAGKLSDARRTIP
jgi:hypothetical protein